MQDNCIFCKIIKGELPSYKIYEDDNFIAILDKFPISYGHLLIISKHHHENILDMPEEFASALYPVAKKLAKAVKEAVDADGINIVQNNGKAAQQAVMHFHLHVIPRKTEDGVRLNMPSQFDITDERLEELAKKISLLI